MAHAVFDAAVQTFCALHIYRIAHLFAWLIQSNLSNWCNRLSKSLPALYHIRFRACGRHVCNQGHGMVYENSPKMGKAESFDVLIEESSGCTYPEGVQVYFCPILYKSLSPPQ